MLNKIITNNGVEIISGIYVGLAFITLLPVLKAILKKIKLKPGGESFDSSNFSEDAKKVLISHYSRIHGTLIFWKNQAEKYRLFHYYTLLWSIPISIIVPIVIQFNDDNKARLFLTVITVHIAIIQAIHKGFKVENNYKAFRLGESEFYDLYRRMLDMPEKFGENEEIQLRIYFEQVEDIRKRVRNAEIDNLPIIQDNGSAQN